MPLEAPPERWAVGHLEDRVGTQVERGLTVARAPGHTYDLNSLARALTNEAEQAAFRAALGTIAPTYWISPTTYEVALGHFAPLRRDPEFVDPDIVAISEHGDRRIIFELKLRSWGEEAVRGILATALMTTAPARTWAVFVRDQARVVGHVASEPAEAALDPDAVDLGMAEAISGLQELPPSALVAQEVRNLSGLTARQLGDVFPVARENFQRWISGDIVPGDDNFARLLSLRHFFRALADRVDDPKVWLLSPLRDAANDTSAYSVLVRGNLAKLWDAIAVLPSRTPTEQFIDSSGDRGVSVTTSLRGVEPATSESDLDEYNEWFDEE